MPEKIKYDNMGWNFNNSYKDLPKNFYSELNLNPVKNPKLVILNKPLAKSLGLNIDSLKTKEGVDILAGNKKAEDGAYIAQAYSGHQFGNFTMLGDGRALLIGEQDIDKQIDICGKLYKKYDIQLKGSGRTPYSRGGDGRAVLGPMLREYIISEAMHGLNIPTTRSLAVVKTGEKVYREDVKEGAILTRVASSHIRFGTFEYAANYLDKEDVKLLADYSINRHYPYIKNDENKYLSFLKEVINSHAILVAKWLCVGFIHGVMNTDNMTISGETIDYGPCAFIDVYKPDTVFSSIDIQGRYAYKNQPNMASWNICRFAETLLPLINEDIDVAILVAKWLCVGFIHGVMNTDNMTISGETIDYGPCAFIDVYKPDTVFSSIDIQGRYAYKNQPNMASWNICRFAETLLPLINEDIDVAVDLAQKAIFEFSDIHFSYWFAQMREKLGLFNEEAMDKAIIEDLLDMMKKYKEDYTNTFVSLTYRKNMNNGMFDTPEFTNWHKNWQDRLERQNESIEEAYELMKKSNPIVIPRNHKVEEALKAADEGDFSLVERLLSILENPYEYKKEMDEYTQLPKQSDLPYRTYCGT